MIASILKLIWPAASNLMLYYLEKKKLSEERIARVYDLIKNIENQSEIPIKVNRRFVELKRKAESRKADSAFRQSK